jgi:glutamate-5-semialdehyde dehydrogenase
VGVLLKDSFEASLQSLKTHQRTLRKLSSLEKNKNLLSLAESLEKNGQLILAANQEDLNNLKPETPPAFRDRLTLNQERIASISESLRQVAKLPDPVGEIVDERKIENGLVLKRARAPLGIIFMIFESRPNVILEAFSLAYKSGNSIILRGGSESKSTAAAIYKIMDKIFRSPVFLGIQDYDREIVDSLLKRKDLIDVVVPRGGEKLIEYVQKTSLMPIIKNDRGLCHAYVSEYADVDMAVKIVDNAKTQRPGVCNSLETVLVHSKIAEKFISSLYALTNRVSLVWHVDERSQKILDRKERVSLAKSEDWNTEYLDQILNCKVVDSLQEAIEHIEKFGSKHSETIVTRQESEAKIFQEEIDAAAVYWNASTRFTDGFEFGLGGELGISTQKLHVRGPVGLRELTSLRWIISGSGQIR